MEMLKKVLRTQIQKIMKGAGTKVPKLGNITSEIKKAEKKGDKATVKKLKSAKTKIINQKKKLADKDKAKKDLASKNKKTRSQKSLATEKGVKFGKKKTMVMAKDRPFGKDLDYQTGVRGEAEVKGRPGGRAAVAETARAGKINIGDDAVGFDNFLELQKSKGIFKREKAMRALEKIIENGTATQKAEAKAMLKKMKSAALKSDVEATRRMSGGQRGKAKPDDFKDAQTMLEKTGEMGAAFERLTKNEQNRLIQSAKMKQMLKKKKEMPSDEAKAKKKLAQRIMATNPRRNKAQGGMGLKMPTADQVGLKKLPTKVRNKMGYMYGGGMAKKPKMGNMDYRKGGLLLIAVDMMKKGKKGK
jgi:hypothetical protein